MHPMPSPNTPASPEALLPSLRFLLMRYARNPTPSIAGHIADCVEQVLAERHLVPLRERCTYRQMRTYWRLVEHLG